MTPDSIEREITIGAPRERVWSLLTSAEHLGSWFGDAGAEIDLRPGGRLELRWEKYGTVRGEVDVVEPPERFAFRWPADHEAGFVEGNLTRVEFTLAAAAEGTVLTVVESGFAALRYGDPIVRHADHVQGWGKELGELRELAEGVAARP